MQASINMYFCFIIVFVYSFQFSTSLLWTNSYLKTNISKFAYFIIALFSEFYFVDIKTKKIILIQFGNTLRKLRLEKGFTQEQLANELGVEISQISRIERGIINTSITNLYAISSALNIEVSELFVFDAKN